MVIYNLFSLFGHVQVVGPIIGLVFFAVYKKLSIFVFLIYYVFNVYLINVSKQAYQDPRPFWVKTQIQELDWIGCSSQYGFPSGHSWISLLLYEPIFADFIGLGPFRVAVILLTLFAVFIPLSRLYLGVHSVDQILCGMVMSFAFLVIYKYFAQKQLFKYLHACAFNKKIGLLLLLTIFINIVLFAVPLILYVVQTTSRTFSI